MNHFYYLLLLVLVTLPIQAEVYQWKDINGKVHFSDRHPRDDSVEVNNLTVSDPNIDQGGEQTKKLTSLFSDGDAWGDEKSDVHVDSTQSRLQKKNAQIRCAKIRQRYDSARGPVVFVDENGRKLTVTRRQADALAAKYKAILDAEC